MRSFKNFNFIQPQTVEAWPYVLVAFLLPIESTAAGNVGFTILAISIVFFFVRDKRSLFRKSEFDFFLCISPFLLYALLFVGLIICGTDDCKKITASFIERQALFGLYPLLLLVIPKFSRHDLEVILNWFWISLIAQLLIILLIPNYERVHYPYLGMYTSFSMACCLHLFCRDRSVPHLVLSGLLFVLLIIIKAKVAMFTAFLLSCIILLNFRKVYLVAIIGIIGFSAALFLAKMSGSFSVSIGDYLNSIFYVKTFSWKCSWQAFEQSGHYWFGVGVGYSEKALNDVYHTYPDWVGYMGYNSHNQYLETLLAQGIIGLGLLLFWIFWLFGVASKNKKVLLFYFVFVITVACVTESILWRQKGIVFWVFFSVLLSKYIDE